MASATKPLRAKLVSSVSAHREDAPTAAMRDGDVPPDVISHVAKASATANEGDLHGALALLLEAWAQHPAEPLGDRIERLGDALVSDEANKTAKAKKVDDSTWDALLKADRLADRRALVHAMIAGNLQSILKRAPQLCALPPDPRLSRTFTAWLGDLPFRALDSRPAWAAVFKYLRRHPDPRSCNVLLELAETDVAAGQTMQKWMRGQITKALENMKAACGIGSNAKLRQALQSLDETLDGAFGASNVQRPAIGAVQADPAELPTFTMLDAHGVGAAEVRGIYASPGGQVLAVRLRPPAVLSIIDAESGDFVCALEGDRVFAFSHDGKRIAYGDGRDVVVIDLHSSAEIARVEVAKQPDLPQGRQVRRGVCRAMVFSADDTQVIAFVIPTTVRRDHALIASVMSVDLRSECVSELLELATPSDGPLEARLLDGNLVTLVGSISWVIDLEKRLVLQAYRSHYGGFEPLPFGIHGTYHAPVNAGAELAIEVNDPEIRLLLVDPRTTFPRTGFALPHHLQDIFVDEEECRVLVQDRLPNGHTKGPPMVARFNGTTLEQPQLVPTALRDFTCTAFDARGRPLVGDRFGQVHVWDLSQSKPTKIAVFRPSMAAVAGLGATNDGAFAWNSALLVFLGGDAPPLVERNAIGAAATTPDGSLLFVGVTSSIYGHPIGPESGPESGPKRKAKKQKAKKRKAKKFTFEKGHVYDITGLATSTTGRVASSSMDHAVILWDFAGKLVRRFAGHPDGAFDVAFHPAGQVLASVGADQTLRLWDETCPDERATFALDHLPKHVAWSADGGTIAWTSDVGLHLMAPDGSRQRSVSLCGIAALSAHPTRALFAVSFDDGVVLVGEDLTRISSDHFTTPKSVAFTPDGHRLFVAAGTRKNPGAVTEFVLEWN